MALDLRFDLNDEKEASAYRDRMLRWRQLAAYSPLLYHDQEPQRSTFILTLKQPIPSAKPRSRPLPSLPFGTAAEYVLVEPMQTGGWKAQVYVAAPLHGTISPTVVFKFIIPSRGDIPDRDTPGIVDGRYFRFPRDMAMGEAASYESLAEFQGSTLPYFYGVHEVSMPWGEPAWVLVFERIDGPRNLEALNDALVRGKASKYRDVGLYMSLFESALQTLRSAHQRDVLHLDVREANILVDEVNDLAVLIDWTSNHWTSPEDRAYWANQDVVRLVNAFLYQGIATHKDELRNRYA